MSSAVLKSADGYVEPDCVHWPADLGLEPETCWCLIHGDELPCGACEPSPSPEPSKES